MDFNNLTLSDFVGMDLFNRDDGSITPLVDYMEGHPIGLVGFNGDETMSAYEIKEAAYEYYKNLMVEINKIQDERN
jgi:hypothetical protein